MSKLPCACPECQAVNCIASMDFLDARRKEIDERNKNLPAPITAKEIGGQGKLIDLFPELNSEYENMMARMGNPFHIEDKPGTRK